MKHSNFQQKLQAYRDAEVVVKSLLKQIGIYSYRQKELNLLIKHCALDLIKGEVSSPVKPISKPIRSGR